MVIMSSTNKRIVRPWDKKRPAFLKRKTSNTPSNDDDDESSTAVPSITVDGVRYWSDRFYLNTSILETTTRDETTTSKNNPGCTCGARHPPPLLDRSRLVASLRLKAAILGTYTIQPKWLAREFPALFGRDATVPTLVLHGQRGWTDDDGLKKKKTKRNNKSQHHHHDESSVQDSVSNASQEQKGDDEDDSLSLCTQPDEKVEVDSNEMVDDDTLIIKEVTTAAKQQDETKRGDVLSNMVHWTEVLPAWIPPNNISTSSSQILTEQGSVSETVRERRESKRGVHHPKFMILLEESGSVVVLVSTANLTQPLSTDATWIQQFPAAALSPNEEASTSSSSSSSASMDSNRDGSDLGAVLANFLYCETLACREDQLTPLAFVRRYLGWRSLKDLETRFDYSQAQAHLIATVPGDHEGRHSNIINHQDCRRGRGPFYYGRQRFAHIVHQLTHKNDCNNRASGSSVPPSPPWIPWSLLSDQDRLVFQPTSFGADWNSRNMSDVVRSYLGEDHRNESTQTDRDLLERLDIVWPTDDFVQQTRQIMRGRVSPKSVMDANAAALFGFAAKTERDDKKLETERVFEGFIFLSSETFNKIDLSCLSQMVMFEPSVPEQRPSTLTPHFKSVARLFEGSDYRIRKDYGVGKTEESFSWFLLTSACLSRGAQGDATLNKAPGSDAVSYSNFELGVLFCSRLQGRDETDRLYCWKPAHCSCSRPSSGARLIHLPVPYCFRPARYQEHEDEAEFCETPYFHEIPAGTGGVGHMRITPWGAALAAKCDGEAS